MPVSSIARKSPLISPFKKLAVSNLAAHMSDQIALIAIPLVAVTALDAGGGATSIIQMLNTLPYLLLAVPFGLLVDRGRRRGIMTAGELVRTLAILVLIVLAFTDAVSLTALTALGVAGSIGTVAYSVAVPNAVRDLVPPDSLARSNGQIELARSIATTAGPALAGALVGYVGSNAAFGIAASLSILAVVNLASLPRDTRTQRASTKSPLKDIIEGARFVSGHEVLRPIVITAILFNTGWFCLQGVYVAYAMTRLDMTSGQTGLTLTLYGVGMVVGYRLAGVLAGRVWFGRLVVIGPICGALASTLMIASLVWPTWLLPSLAWLLLGSGPMIWTISTTTLRQMITPPDMLGRVSALLVTSTAGFRPVGAGLGAVSYLLGGYEAVLTVSWVAFLAQAAVIIRSRAARVTDIPALETPQVAVN